MEATNVDLRFKTGVGVMVKDDICHYVQTQKGLRQGDPIVANIV